MTDSASCDMQIVSLGWMDDSVSIILKAMICGSKSKNNVGEKKPGDLGWGHSTLIQPFNVQVSIGPRSRAAPKDKRPVPVPVEY
jgi:hypothetical protein